MSCVNIKSPEYLELVKGMNKREEFLSRALISRYMTENNNQLPDYVTLKQLKADIYNTNKSGINYEEFFGEVKGMIKKLLPGLSDKQIEDHVRFIDKMELMRLRDGKEVLSTFINNTIYLSKTLKAERNSKAYTDVRHEVFHTIFNNFLSDKEQVDIAASFKRWKPEFASIHNKEELEEKMADAFEDYKNAENKPRIVVALKNFFEELLRFFGLMDSSYNDITRLFNDVNEGRFTRNFVKDSLVTRDKTLVLERYKDPELFLQCKSWMINTLNEYMYPEDSKKLSPENNKESFLKLDDYESLFKNNKNFFKIGFTKQDALRFTQNKVKDIRDSRPSDPELEKVINKLSNYEDFKVLFEYLQPFSAAKVEKNGELKLINQQGEDPTVEELEEDDSFNSLEIGSKELINPITKISEVVKDFLSSVTYNTARANEKENFVNIDPGVGFVSLLNLLQGLQGNTSVEDNKETLKRNYKDFPGGIQTKAVYNKLISLHDEVTSYKNINLNIKEVPKEELNKLTDKLKESGIKYEVSKNLLKITLDTDNLRIENQGTNIEDNQVVFIWNRKNEPGDKKSFGPIPQLPTESNKTFIEKIANQTGLPNFIVAKLFNYNEKRNTLTELTKVAGSLRKLNPKFVKVATIQNINEDDGSKSRSTKFTFINSVRDYKTDISISTLIREKLEDKQIWNQIIDTIKSFEEKHGSPKNDEILGILKKILVDEKHLSILTAPDFAKIRVRDAGYIYDSLKKALTSFDESGINKNEEDNYSDYLRHTSNLATKIGKYAIEKNNPTSFNTSTSNKSKWENVMKNSGLMVFKNLADYASGIITHEKNLLDFFKGIPGNYLKYNPIFKKDSTGNYRVDTSMLRTTDPDYISDMQETFFENKLSNYDKKPIPFHKESKRDWVNRNFLAMFLLSVNDNQSNNTSDFSYYQQKYQPESAPNVGMIKMGINNGLQIRSHIKSMMLQEAFMQHKYANSGSSNLRKNSKKSYLPGLEKSNPTYFLKNGVNRFIDQNGDEIRSEENNRLLEKLTDEILENLDGTLEDFVDVAINEKSHLQGSQIADMASKLNSYYLEKYRLTKEDKIALRNLSITENSDIDSLKKQSDFQQQREALKKAMSIYYLNSYVNGKFMNQLSSGATQNYKNPLDEVKRQAGVNAMHDTGLIDNQHGMQEKYNNLVVKAVNTFYGESNPLSSIELLKRFFNNKKLEQADAQTYDLPEYKKMLRKSFGKSVDIGVITKDVHFANNKIGITGYRKTSSAELTNELVRKNKTLRDLRYEMTFRRYLDKVPEDQRVISEGRINELYNKLVDQGELRNVDDFMDYDKLMQELHKGDYLIHKASFDSAIKGSKPVKIANFGKDSNTGTLKLNFTDDAVEKFESAYTGIQQSIRHRYIDSFISHFTQLTYLIGLNRTETSIKNNKIITNSLAQLAKSGLYDTLFKLKAHYDEGMLKVSNKTKGQFLEELKRKLDGPGNERLLDLLNTKGISMNNPLFTEKLMQTFFNSLTKNTVKPKHPGGSFVLQSEFGFEENQQDKKNSLRKPELKRDSQGNLLYAECYLPAMYSGEIQTGDMVYYDNSEYNKMFGFRVPSSDLHSSVPLKVIGYYPSKAHDNVIVIPAAVTALHGSDFDVDKLFVVRYGVYGVSQVENDPKSPIKEQQDKDEIRYFKTRFQTNNKIIAQHGVKFGYTAPNAAYDEKGNLKSFGDNKHIPVDNLEKILLSEKSKTQNQILVLRQSQPKLSKGEIKKEETRREASLKSIAYTKIEKEINSLETHLKTLSNIQKGMYSNKILDAVLDNISYSGQNASDVLYGITFDPMKGYEETSELSRMAEVYSKINQEKGIKDTLSPRPELYKTLDEARSYGDYDKIEKELRIELGVDTSSEKGKKDLLELINEELKDNWVKERNVFIDRNRTRDIRNNSLDINRPDHHVNVHRETYMAAGLVGLVANFSKGLAYAFHGITDGSNSIKLDLSRKNPVVVDGTEINELVLENKDGVKNQELKSLVLNAAIDHVKEQILNMINVGDNTAKIFLAAISTKLNFHQASMMMLQPVAKALNGSDVTKVSTGLKKMQERIEAQFAEGEYDSSMMDKVEITTEQMEKNIQQTLDELIADKENPEYKNNLLFQLKMIQALRTMSSIGDTISNLSRSLSIIQELPYNLETSYDKLNQIEEFINVGGFYDKLKYTEDSAEYDEKGFKTDLSSKNNILSNVNVANNSNVLSALEAIKVQLDLTSELFTENSLQMQHLVNTFLGAASNNSDPETLFDGENNKRLTFDTTKKMTSKEKYLQGKTHYNVVKTVSRSILNFLTTGLNITYNKAGHSFSLGIRDQQLSKITKKDTGEEFIIGPVRSYLDQFLAKTIDARKGDKYNGDNYIVSQINPEWRIKPLTLIKQDNHGNRFLDNVGIGTDYKNKVRTLFFNTNSINSAENIAEIGDAFNRLNSITGIYVRKNKKGVWEDVPSNEHPITEEMSEVVFNILKTSLYTDQFSFNSSKATSIIPPTYFVQIFKSFDNLVKDLMLYRKNEMGNKYYKNYSDMTDRQSIIAPISTISENLFINTIFSHPEFLPNVKGKYDFDNKKNVGVLPNGNIYDFYINAEKLKDKKEEDGASETPKADKTINSIEDTEKNNNEEVDEDLSKKDAEEELYNRFKKNPSFLVDEDRDRKGRYELYMKVGQTGDNENNNLRYYYKKIANISGTLTNSSFDLNVLLNNYKIKDYFNPKRFSIPVKTGVDINQDKVTLDNIPISTFISNVNDGKDISAKNSKAIKEYEEKQIEELRKEPGNENKTNEELKRKIKSRFGVETVINKVNEVSLYDSRNLDRIGLKNFKILSKTISKDKQNISLELEALPKEFQQNFSKFDSPFDVLQNKEDSIKARNLSRSQMIDYINNTMGTKKISVADDSISDGDVYNAYLDAKDKREELESEEFVHKNEC